MDPVVDRPDGAPEPEEADRASQADVPNEPAVEEAIVEAAIEEAVEEAIVEAAVEEAIVEAAVEEAIVEAAIEQAVEEAIVEAAATAPGEPASDSRPASVSDEDVRHAVDAAIEVEADSDANAEDDHDQLHDAESADSDRPAAPAPTTVAELVAATLRAAGVRIAFTVPGESFLPVMDALHAAGIRIVATRHEGAAAMAAEAYGQLTGRPAACLGTRAVGATNLAIGVHTATADSSPMFVLVGDIKRADRGREAFQEVDLVGTVGRLAKWAGSIEDAAAAVDVLEAAARAVLEGRPGPALIAIPEDVQGESIPDGTRVPIVRPHPDAPSAADVRTVLNALASAERPVILAGAGVLRARCSNDLVRLAELLHVPVVASWRRGDVIPNDHPLYLGMTGFGSPGAVRERLEAADLIVVVGSRLSEPTTSGYRVPAPGQRWIHVDVSPRADAHGNTPAPLLSVRADARAFLRAATARLKDAVLLAAPLAARDRHNAADRAAWEAATVVDVASWSGPGVHPGKIIADLRRLLPEDAILTTDAGAFAGWAARGYRFRRPGTFLGPTSGAMGYAFPAALAAALVHRERRVVALVGDGGMGMTLAELETAVREGAHVVTIVFDNERYGMIRDHQARQGSPSLPGTDLGPLDFAAAARACGARGIRVEADGAFEGALRTALAAAGPTVIQLAVDRRWVSVDRPPADSAR